MRQCGSMEWSHAGWCVFFFNDTATTEIYTLSLSDALPISAIKFRQEIRKRTQAGFRIRQIFVYVLGRRTRYACIWEKSNGPKQQVSLNQTLSMMKKTPAKMKKDGLQPSQIHAYSVNGRERFVVVWEQSVPTKKPQ